jgi:hypothetical protein
MSESKPLFLIVDDDPQDTVSMFAVLSPVDYAYAVRLAIKLFPVCRHIAQEQAGVTGTEL